MKEINRHKNDLGECDVVIGIGGGKTLDTAKVVSYYAHLPVIIVPTVASSDAPCSRLSVIYTESGAFEQYLPLTANPDIVIMDTEIIAKAPVRFLMAGIGDALATYYEASACEKRLMEAATASCAENDTMGNMPFEVCAEDILAAIKTADQISKSI